MATSLFQLESIDKIYNRQQADEMQALSDISIDVEAGETVALTGPSGSGKTTLLSLMGCLSRPTSGRISFQGRNVSTLPEHILAGTRREAIGFIFQHYHLIRDLSVIDNLRLPMYPANLSWKAIDKRALQLLERFDLTSRKEKKTRLLSGGEQQRVAVARALMGDPDVILADEPTAHLDQSLSEELLTLFGELRSEGKTIIIATHDPLVYQSDLIQRRVALRHGRLVEDLCL